MGGGVGNALSSLACIDRKYEHTIILLQRPEKTGFVDKCLSFGIGIWEEPTGTEICSLLKKCDVVIFHWWNHPLLNKFMIDYGNIPVRSIIWCHVSGNNYPFISFDFLSSFDYVLFTSQYSYENKWWGDVEKKYLKNRSNVLYGMGPLIPGTFKKSYISEGKIKIGYVGTLQKSKMHHEYVRACASILKVNPNIQFIILGDREDGGWIIEEAKILGIEESISLLGYVNNVEQHLCDFDIFGYPLNPNSYATTENSILEAMLAGIPVVALRQGTEKYIIDDEVDGILCNNMDEYINAILELSFHEIKRKKIGERARKDVVKKFNFFDNLKVFNDSVEIVLNRKKRGVFLSSIIGESPYEWFLYFVNPDDKVIFDNSQYNRLGEIYKGKSKSSVFQYLNYFPLDSKLQIIAEGINNIDG